MKELEECAAICFFMFNAILYDVRHSAQFKFLYQSTHLYLLYITYIILVSCTG
jgi:hypothetical protein